MQFAPSSYGQLHINFNAPTQYQSTSQMHPPSVSSSRQLSLSSESQSTAPVTSLQHSVEQPSVPTSVALVRCLSFSFFNTVAEFFSIMVKLFLLLCCLKCYLSGFLTCTHLSKFSGNKCPAKLH